MRRVGAFTILILAFGWLAGCSINPVTGERELVLMSPEREAALGAQEAISVAKEIGLVDDPSLSNYVATIGQRLAVVSPRQDVSYEFHVADMPEPNAFALPGGYIYVSRGLLALFNSEAELANVLGHEIGHVAARHAAQRETRSMGVNILTVLGTVAAAAAGGAEAAQTASQIGQIAGAGLIASYGRDQERQSDEIGQKLAAESGWSPEGMAQFLATLEKDTVLRTGSQPRPSYFDSHPMLGERVQTASARARELPVAPFPPIADGRGAFFQRIDGIRLGVDPAEGVFDGPVFRHADLDFALTFPDGWATQNQKAAVIGVAPQQDAYIALQLQGPPGQPQEAARQFAEANQLRLQNAKSGTVGGYRAYHAVAEAASEQGNVALHLTWLAHSVGMFRITGTTPVERYGNHSAAFAETAGSARPLSNAERAAFVDVRLKIVNARAGETLQSLSQRTANAWSIEETVVANDLPADQALAAGFPVKIAVAIPFRP